MRFSLQCSVYEKNYEKSLFSTECGTFHALFIKRRNDRKIGQILYSMSEVSASMRHLSFIKMCGPLANYEERVQSSTYSIRKFFLPGIIQGEACFPQLSVEPTEI
jgi:hypothetical protein